MGVNDDILNLSQLWDKRTNARPNRGILGDANGVIVDPNLPLTNVLVREPTSNGLSSARTAILPSSVKIPLTAGTPILTGYNHNLDRIVLGVDTETNAAGGVSTSSTVQRSNTPSTTQGMITTLGIISAGGMLVNLKGWNAIANGTYYQFSKSGIDLSSAVPSSGYMRYACILVLSDFSDVEITTSTPVLTSDLPLGVSDVQECLSAASAGSTPAWAVKLIGGLTSIDQAYLDNPANVVDLRQMVNNSAAVVPVVNFLRVVTAAGAVAVTTTDYIIVVNKSVGAATTVDLPASPATGLTFVVKDGKGDALINNITITPNAGNIDGASTLVLNLNYQSATVVYNGSEWSAIG